MNPAPGRLAAALVWIALTLTASAPWAQSGTGSPEWEDLVLRVHARTVPIDVGAATPERPAILASSLRVGTNILLMEDTDNAIYSSGWLGREGEQSIQRVLTTLYEVLEDDYDFVTVVLNWDVRGAFAFYLPLANETIGIGLRNTAPFLDRFDTTEGRLQGFIMMNHWRFYRRDDNEDLSRIVWLQEIGHRWGSFVHFDPGNGERSDLLGRDRAHWSYFMHTENSALEGNDWHENSDGSFSTYTNARRTTYGQLDLYLMGLARSETVPDFFFIDNPDTRGQRDSRGAPISRSSAPELGGEIRTIFGERVDVSIEDIVAAEGPRNPGFEDAQKVFRMATVYLVRAGTEVNEEEFDQVETLVEDWEILFEEATRGRMNLIVNLDGEEAVSDVGFGDPCEESAQCDNITATVCISVDDDERICSKRCTAHPECGEGFCCDDFGQTGDLFCYPGMFPCDPESDGDPSDAGDIDTSSPQDSTASEEPDAPEGVAAMPDSEGCSCSLPHRPSRLPSSVRARSHPLWLFSTFL